MNRSLVEYRRKRHFDRTPEPAGEHAPSSRQPVFVVQKHDASRLHYDFRLQAQGVLKSWAVPKGPSLNPEVKRLAVPTEDHPLDYRLFEGVIPPGEYGAGRVIVWDTGAYRNLTAHDGKPVPVATGVQRGHVAVWLEGMKLRGGFALTRIRSGSKPIWLLVKMKDEFADERDDLLLRRPESVLSGRTLDDLQRESLAGRRARPG